MAGPWEAYQTDEKTPRERKAAVEERKGSAEAQAAEAEAPYVGRKAAADTDKAEAEARRAKALADKEEAAAAERAKKASAANLRGAKAQQLEATLGYLGTLQRARDLISSGMATGPFGQVTGNIYGSSAADLKGALDSIANPIVLDALQEARKGSAVGATGFGALTQKELDLLKSKFGSLKENQGPEALLAAIDQIEGHYRRALAYSTGYDPYTAEGAALVGLPLPEGAEAPVAPPKGEIGSGEWVADPELRGVDAAIKSMIKSGRSADQVRQWLNEYQPGLGDKVRGIEDQVSYHRRTGEDPQGTVERYFKKTEPSLLNTLADNPVGAGIIAASDELASGFLSELSAGELSGPEYEQQAAIQRGLREKYPTASGIGQVMGTIGSTIGGAVALGKQGLKLPGLLEGIGQEAIYGFGSAEPGSRVENAAFNAALTPLSNFGGKLVGDVVGGTLRGADPDVAVLKQKYGIDLTPGQLAGKADAERTVAGLPIVGPQVTDRRNDTLQQFNEAAFTEALAPIGARVDEVGQRGVAKAQDEVSKAYEAALGGRTFQFDQPFIQTVQGKPYAALRGARSAAGPKAADEIDRILGEINVNGAVDGRAWQQARRQLIDMQGSNEIADDIAGVSIKENLGEIIDSFDDLVKRQAPDAYEGYVAANTAYRNTKILERAVDYAPQGDVFGPGNLRSATRQGTQQFGGKAASARGDRPFNELVMAALKVIPEKADETSLGGRMFGPTAGAVGLGSLGAAATMAQPKEDIPTESNGALPAWLIAAALGAGSASIPYSRGGNRLAGLPMLGSRTDNQRQLGRLVQEYTPALARGIARNQMNEPGVPTPQTFDYNKMGSPEMRELIRLAVEGDGTVPTASEPMGGFVPTYEDVPPEGTSPMMLDGRPIVRDPETDEMVFGDTGEPVPGYERGGAVSFQERQRAQQERIAAGSRQQQQAMSQARDQRTAPSRERVAAASPEEKRAAMARAQSKPQTDAMTNLTMAASRRGNDLVAGLADLMDHYGLTPADAVAWAAENIEGRSPEEVARIRQNLSGLGSNRDLVNAGAMSNERRFREAGGLGAREYDEEALPRDWSAAGYNPGAILPALASEAPRAGRAVRDYFASSTPQSVMSDVGNAAKAGWEYAQSDPYGMAFEGLMYSNPITATAAGAGDYTAMREGSRMLDQYTAEDPLAAQDQRMIDALSVLPLTAPFGVRRGRPRVLGTTRPAPEMENVMAYPEFTPEGAPVSMLAGRPMSSAEQALYASRRMSAAELQDAMASGEFRMPPSGQTQHGVGKKWWSPADDEGVFGRPWAKGGPDAATVRVPMDQFNRDFPIRAAAAQRWDAATQSWVPLARGR